MVTVTVTAALALYVPAVRPTVSTGEAAVVVTMAREQVGAGLVPADVVTEQALPVPAVASMLMPAPCSVMRMPAFAPGVMALPMVNAKVAVVAAAAVKPFALDASVTARFVRPIPGKVPVDAASRTMGAPAEKSLDVAAAMLAKAA